MADTDTDRHLKSVPCVQINATNVSQWWHCLSQCVQRSHLLAIDLELSGLGDRQKLNAKKIDERYEAVAAAAKSRSVLSIGFAFFEFCDTEAESDNNGPIETNPVPIAAESVSAQDKCDNESANPYEDSNRFQVLDQRSESVESLGAQTESNSELSTKEWKLNAKLFNMLCLCEEEYVCEPETMRFLAGHGFDFNGQCLHGLPYHRGNDLENHNITKPTLRNLMNEIIGRKLPIVFHNGFIDLIFLYQNFYAELPNDLQSFIADLAEMFPSGVYDTKYIADFHERLNRSYLEYLFYERQRLNIERAMKGQMRIELHFPIDDINPEDIECTDLSTNLFNNETDLLVDICHDYANHGWCRQNHSCNRSHNIDLILDKKKRQNKKLKKMIKKMQRKGEQSRSGSQEESCRAAKQGVHRAGYDAFMTGYCLAFFMAVNANRRPNRSEGFSAKTLGFSQFVNNIYLTGKDQSLRITASSFAKTSNNHKNKISKIHPKE